ncbi:MAG: 50S ribosome-binding GTPase [Gammaproteobacteria bacterium]|nr:50S ribosome-binding GTPase [Gammaproteobacteria bacterium]
MQTSALHQQLLPWLDRQIQRHWLDPELLRQLDSLERQQAEDLFRDRHHRPLLVALFGGTGVGKSSLLNRLAGAEIARTGLQRPTSVEVSLYLHRDFQIDLLPAELPMAQTRIAYHDEAARRLLAWIDMPDMDSTALANRQLVEAWLPYIDWLIYVVSPERYHDDQGWRFLQQRRQRHAWIFVMNQWDQGRPEQLEDFRQRLASEGFVEPILLRTSCLADAAEDDFAQLEQRINQAIQQHSLELLQQLGTSARRQDLQQLLARIDQRLGDDAAWRQARSAWLEQRDRALAAFAQALLSRSKRQLAGIKESSLATLPAHFAPLAEALSGPQEAELLASGRLELLNQLAADGLPMALFEAETAPPSVNRLQQLLGEQLDQALAKPGHWLQRGLFRLSQQLEWLLPLGAGGWAVQHALSQFYLGTRGEGGFLGLDFAIHSLLLIGLGWLLPRLLRQKLEPTPSAVLQQGLQQGLRALRTELEAEDQDLWDRLEQERQDLRNELRSRFIQPLQQQNDPASPGLGSLTANAGEAARAYCETTLPPVNLGAPSAGSEVQRGSHV